MYKIKRAAIVTFTATVALIGAVMVPASAQALGQYPTGQTGIDISYPSCHQKNLTGYPFVVAGVSGGSVYTDNKCAAQEAADAPNASLYVNTGLYTGGNYFAAAMSTGNCAATDKACGAYEYGYLAAQHAYNYAISQGLGTTATTWWLDVEDSNTWDANLSLNVQEIQGEYDALNASVAAGSTIGIYAVPSQWAGIVGNNWPSTGHAYPVWAANGFRTADGPGISQYCSDPTYSVTGGPVEMVQYVVNYGTHNSLDHDYAC